jgi:hypothetical protein
LEKILKELDESDVFKIITKGPNKSLNLKPLMGLIFKEGIPDRLVKNLTPEEKKNILNNEAEETESIWNSIKNYFGKRRGISTNF